MPKLIWLGVMLSSFALALPASAQEPTVIREKIEVAHPDTVPSGYIAVPDPTNSTVAFTGLIGGGTAAAASPAGNGSSLSTDVRDQFNSPMAGVPVIVTLISNCAICLCGPIQDYTDGNGHVDLLIPAGLDASADTACCIVTTIVTCYGVTLSENTLDWLSPDMTGDCVVEGLDYAIFATDWLTSACRSDFERVVSPYLVEGLDYSFFAAQWLSDCSPIPVAIDLEIYNGQVGSLVPDDVEETKGAFTVANLNDTDGDGTQDVSDDTVAGEKDLMKIILKKPVPDLGGQVTLTLTGDGTKLRLWKLSTKGASEETRRAFLTAELPKTLWVEGRQKSDAFRDVEIKLRYAPGPQAAEDRVRATLVWAEKTSFWNSGSDGGNLFGDAGEPAETTFDVALGSQLGLQISAFGVHNSMEMEFTVYPPGIGGHPDVVFDVTRQIYRRSWEINHGTVMPKVPEDYPAPDEEPNDDIGVTDEDNTPTNDHIYSIDGPGLALDTATDDFFIQRFNFREFSRVRFDGSAFANDETIEGSRCSPKAEWYSITYVKRGSDGKWKRDNDDISASAPQLTGTGNGSMSVPTTGASAVTEGWTVTYSTADSKWTVVGTVSGVQTNKATTGTPYSSDGNEVSFTITAGGTAFANGDYFKFSTFKTASAGGKKNEVEQGQTAIAGP